MTTPDRLKKLAVAALVSGAMRDDEGCPDCNGTGMEECFECEGSGVAPDYGEDEDLEADDCFTCDGTGEVECDYCGGSGEDPS